MTRAIEQKDFQQRVSQFSLHGQKNGRVDVLPPSAEIEDHSVSSILEQKKILEDQLIITPRDDKNRINSIKSQLGNIKKMISLAVEERKGWVFMQVANKRLKHELFKALDLEAETIIAYRAVQGDDLDNTPV